MFNFKGKHSLKLAMKPKYIFCVFCQKFLTRTAIKRHNNIYHKKDNETNTKSILSGGT